MKTYKFAVSLCGGWCNGGISINANNEEEAHEKAMDYVVDKLVKAFPTLDIEYYVECENPDDEEESYTVSAYDCEGSVMDLVMYDNKADAIREAKRWGFWDEVVNDNTGEVVWRKGDSHEN